MKSPIVKIGLFFMNPKNYSSLDFLCDKVIFVTYNFYGSSYF